MNDVFANEYALKCSTGSGDVDTSKVVKADADGAIVGASGWSCPEGLFCLYYSFNGIQFEAKHLFM